MKLIYQLSDKKFLSFGTDDMPSYGQGLIEVTDETTINNIQSGYIVSIDKDLKITTTAPAKTPAQLAKENIDIVGVLSPSNLTNKQIQDIVYYLALKGGLISS